MSAPAPSAPETALNQAPASAAGAPEGWPARADRRGPWRPEVTVILPTYNEAANLPVLLADIIELYANRGVNVVKVANGYAFRTAPDLSEKLKIEKPVTRKLSRAAIETLAIIAYHQPVTRTEIEQVRGVGLSKGTLDLLFEQNWIRPMGRRRVPGRPVTWGTTDFFLEHFGLPSIEDLPGHRGLLDGAPDIHNGRFPGHDRCRASGLCRFACATS